MSKKHQHVVPHGKGWAVRGEGNNRITKVTTNQQDAINIARAIAQNQGSEVFIHGRDGKIRDRDSYGNDPYPPEDKKH